MQKIGILITNLGTPEAPNKQALKKYLKQFLGDKRVTEPTMPKWLWWFALNFVILNIRPKKSALSYKTIWGAFGNGSPLLDISLKQRLLLQENLGNKLQVELGMRYGHPSIKNALNKLKKCSKIIILPLYPQYSSPTTGSTFDELANVFSTYRVIPEIKFINSYFDNNNYIQALVISIRDYWNKFDKADKLIISYHGIPTRYVKNGDIYAQHCQITTKLLVKELNLKKDQYLMTYQSRFGREEWLNPYLNKTLESLPKEGVKSVQIVCPGFSSDCLETLEEIKIENRKYFLNAGGKKFEYIPALNFSSEHIEFLKKLINHYI